MSLPWLKALQRQRYSQFQCYSITRTKAMKRDRVDLQPIALPSSPKAPSNQAFVHFSDRYSSVLQSKEMLLSTVFAMTTDAVAMVDSTGQIVAVNPVGCRLFGRSEAELQSLAIAAVVTPSTDIAALLHAWAEQEQLTGRLEIVGADGTIREATYRAIALDTNNSIVLMLREIGEHQHTQAEIARLNAEWEQRVTERIAELKQANEELHKREQQLQQAVAREQLLANLTQEIRRSLDLDRVLTTTVSRVRQLLNVDRVLIYRFNPDWSGLIAVESVREPSLSMLGRTIYDPCFGTNYVEQYRQGRVRAMDDIYALNLAPCYVEFLESIQVQANLVVPILQFKATTSTALCPDLEEHNHLLHPTLWGLLVAHQSTQARQWEQSETDLLQQLASQVGIGIQQCELYAQVRQLNINLEHQVTERTTRLQQALNFEAVLKQITDSVRDSLDEDQILQSAVRALALELQVECCDTGSYNADQSISTICYEYTASLPPVMGRKLLLSNEPDLYGQLLQGQWLQFCSIAPDLVRSTQYRHTILACPIQDDRGVIGDLWLFKPRELVFNELEVRLVRQVANQCAIAIRQARLYQAAQSQVNELEKLNQLKDDFLCTVSHELRTPMSNINLAARLLEVLMQREGLLEKESSQARRYLQILQDECQREIELINDLLDLQRLDAGTNDVFPSIIHLQHWMDHLVEPFEARTISREQRLEVYVDPALPPLVTDQTSLERIVTELLNNACKYTPPGEQITVSARLKLRDELHQKQANERVDPENVDFAIAPSSWVEIQVCNTGASISNSELIRVFDKFYRVPNGDPWKHGGTGLGLALVKKLTEHLGGTIEVWSDATQTTFTVTLAIDGPLAQSTNKKSPA